MWMLEEGWLMALQSPGQPWHDAGADGSIRILSTTCSGVITTMEQIKLCVLLEEKQTTLP